MVGGPVSFATLLVQPVVIVRPGTTTDRYGNQVPDWATATRSSTKAWIAEQDTQEIVVGRDATVSTWRAFLAPDVTVLAGDRIEWDVPGSPATVTFDVVGQPVPASTPRGLHHWEVSMRTSTG